MSNPKTLKNQICVFMRNARVPTLYWALLLVGCDKRPNAVPTEQNSTSPTVQPTQAAETNQRVAGQVFIVTETSQNIPLALVDVMVYPAETIENFLSAKSTLSEDIQGQLKKRFDNLTKTAQETEAHRPIASEKLDRDIQELVNLSASAAQRPAQKLEESFIVKHFKQLLATEQRLRDEYGADLVSWPTSEFYFSGLPEPLASVKTDGDGRFALKLKSSTQYIFVASAIRRIGEQSEEYHWMVRLPVPITEDTQILLSNHNLVTSESKDSVVACKGNRIKHPLREIYVGSGMYYVPNN